MLGHKRLRYTVLKGADRAALVEVGKQIGQHGLVGRLLGQKEHHVIDSLHLRRGNRPHRNGKIRLADDSGPFFVHGLDVGLIAVHHFYRTAVSGQIGSQHGSHRAAAQYCDFHRL
ncbi:hypothetical protein SDC9_118548 [bioreactor metagenome]|uniref:Uncharacterized protein n=1 Tax=bioreactor metagenome TaxID=1076179 RepID=A0A645C1E0_9ZZZZ